MKILIDNIPEIWKDIPITNGRYQVSNKGRVKSIRYVHNRGYNSHIKETFIKAQKCTNGYRFVHLSVNGTSRQILLHRLVMLAFVGDSNKEVNHKDGDKSNNCLQNLEYVTHSENQYHSYRVLKNSPVRSWLGKKGFEHNKSIAVQFEDINSGEIIVFGSMREAEVNGYNRKTISRAIKRKVLFHNKFKVSYYEGVN